MHSGASADSNPAYRSIGSSEPRRGAPLVASEMVPRPVSWLVDRGFPPPSQKAAIGRRFFQWLDRRSASHVQLRGQLRSRRDSIPHRPHSRLTLYVEGPLNQTPVCRPRNRLSNGFFFALCAGDGAGLSCVIFEARSAEAISSLFLAAPAPDCFAALAMTACDQSGPPPLRGRCSGHDRDQTDD